MTTKNYQNLLAKDSKDQCIGKKCKIKNESKNMTI